jgi:hypothetical protein
MHSRPNRRFVAKPSICPDTLVLDSTSTTGLSHSAFVALDDSVGLIESEINL